MWNRVTLPIYAGVRRCELVGRGGLEPPTSAVERPDRCADQHGENGRASDGVLSGQSWTPDPVEHMPAEPVTFGQPGMIEVVDWIARHADSLHHSPRASIRRDGE